MSSIKLQKETVDLVEKLKTFKNTNNTNDDNLINQIKINLANLNVLIPPINQINNQNLELLLLTRNALELIVLNSIQNKNQSQFESNFSLLKPFYFDYKHLLSPYPSQNFKPILGLNLLRLLSQNKIADFHIELELIDSNLFDHDEFISHPIQIEKYLMEGSYNRVLMNRLKTPRPEYDFFINILVDTIRLEISNCSESSYNTLPLHDLTTMLHFKTDLETESFINQNKHKFLYNWEIVQNDDLMTNNSNQNIKIILFNKSNTNINNNDIENDNTTIHADLVIDRSLGYARELELIV